MDQSRCKYWIRPPRSLTNVTQQFPKAALGRSRWFWLDQGLRVYPGERTISGWGAHVSKMPEADARHASKSLETAVNRVGDTLRFWGEGAACTGKMRVKARAGKTVFVTDTG